MLCPYDSSHHIRRCKMSFHLVKCKKNHGEQKMVPCDFDATHMIPEPELQYHHQSCPNRKTIEARITKSRTGSENKFPVQNIQVTVSENWDDNYYPSYDPVKYSERNDVLRHMDVESEAKRKNFRLGERQRLNELSKQNQSPSRVPSSDDAVNLPSRLK
ncbi:D7, partial [Asbolus verrucosus]